MEKASLKQLVSHTTNNIGKKAEILKKELYEKSLKKEESKRRHRKYGRPQPVTAQTTK